MKTSELEIILFKGPNVTDNLSNIYYNKNLFYMLFYLSNVIIV